MRGRLSLGICLWLSPTRGPLHAPTVSVQVYNVHPLTPHIPPPSSLYQHMHIHSKIIIFGCSLSLYSLPLTRSTYGILFTVVYRALTFRFHVRKKEVCGWGGGRGKMCRRLLLSEQFFTERRVRTVCTYLHAGIKVKTCLCRGIWRAYE